MAEAISAEDVNRMTAESDASRVPRLAPASDTYERMSDDDLRREFDRTKYRDSLRPKTGDPEDACDVEFRLLDIDGPQDLGKGPVYSIRVVDAEANVEVYWIGWKTALATLENPVMREWVRRGNSATCSWTKMKGATNEYYIFNADLA